MLQYARMKKHTLTTAVTLASAALAFCACTSQKAPEQQPEPTPAEQKSKVTPTPAQRAAAREVLEEQETLRQEEEALLNTPAAADDTPAPADISTGGLRLRRFAPPEEAVSSNEGNEMPAPNAAELHGLRSPVLRGGNLPMDINGKITPETQE